MAQVLHVPSSPKGFTLVVLIVLGIVVASVIWYASSDESNPSVSSSARESGPVSQSVQQVRPSRPAPILGAEVVVVARTGDQAREIRHHLAQDEYIANAFGGPRTRYTVETASSWVSQAELNELNTIRASLGELPIKAIYLD